MNVLLADKIDASTIASLELMDVKLFNNPEITVENIGEAVNNSSADILVVRSTKVPASAMKNSSLKLIIRAGAGYDNIDVDAATECGIAVCNCPGTNSAAVAELTIGLLTAIDRRIPDNVIQLREGKWNKKEFSKGRGLAGKRIGLIGYGNIAKLVGRVCLALGMDVSVYSNHSTSESIEKEGFSKEENLLGLAKSCDVISVHCSLRDDTRGCICESFLNSMKEGSYLINTSRKEVVDMGALLNVLRSGKIFAGLDVFEGECSTPEGLYDGELRGLPNVYCTHHIGASTSQAQAAVGEKVVSIISEFLSSGNAVHRVN